MVVPAYSTQAWPIEGCLSAPLIPDYLFSVGFVMWIGAHMHVFGGSIRVLDDAFYLAAEHPLSQVHDAAWMEVAEWRDDVTCRNCRWAVWSSEGLELGLRSGQQQAWRWRST